MSTYREETDPAVVTTRLLGPMCPLQSITIELLMRNFAFLAFLNHQIFFMFKDLLGKRFYLHASAPSCGNTS